MRAYQVILALHLFGVIFWIGGLLMLATLTARVPEEVGLPRERMLGALRGSFRTGANLGAIITIVLGALLILMNRDVLVQGWLHAKLLLIAVIVGYQIHLYRRIRHLEENPSESSGGEFRMAHGIISLLVLVILLLTILKPF